VNERDASYRVMLVEDEVIPRENMLRLLAGRPEFRICAVACDGREALEILARESPDLLITDISLPYRTGIEIVESLERMPYVIFATSYDHFAARAFELGAVDYIVKPVQRDRLNVALDRFLTFAQKFPKADDAAAVDTRDAGLSINEGGVYYFLAHDDIAYISAADRKTVLHTTQRAYAAGGLIKSFESKLPSASFLRIHKTYIINAKYYSHMRYLNKTPHVFLNDSDETALPVGRKYFVALKERFGL
jgi:two-component system LytT family response regulator